MKLRRRTLLKAATPPIAFPTIIPASALGRNGRPAPGERITFASIGLGAMGMGDMRNHIREPITQFVAVCDVQSAHNRAKPLNNNPTLGREPAKRLIEAHYAKEKASGKYKGCDSYTDFRELCARKDIDAIIVATPDHWHALATLEALRNGKDVYCEKPVTHLFSEGQAVYREVAKRKAIFQTGSQQRSDQRFRHCAELVLNGHLGRISKVEVGLPTGHISPPDVGPRQEIPKGLNYDFWCGPSPVHPYRLNRHHQNWRWHLHYGGGQLMDWIGHHNDCAHWGMDLDRTGPVKVEASGFEYPEKRDLWNAPAHYTVRSEYAGGFEIIISSRNRMGVKYIGEDGWVHVTRGRHQASKPEWLPLKFDTGLKKAYKSTSHARNFIESIQSRKPAICPAETAHRSITPGHLGYVSQSLGRALKWDPKKEKVIGDQEADKLLKTVDYRKPWKLG
jgi:predicted dehydrogenase